MPHRGIDRYATPQRRPLQLDFMFAIKRKQYCPQNGIGGVKTPPYNTWINKKPPLCKGRLLLFLLKLFLVVLFQNFLGDLAAGAAGVHGHFFDKTMGLGLGVVLFLN